MSHLESTESLESNALAEKEGFEPSLAAKPHGNSVGIPSEGSTHAFECVVDESAGLAEDGADRV